jgi:hypothetical protein
MGWEESVYKISKVRSLVPYGTGPIQYEDKSTGLRPALLHLRQIRAPAHMRMSQLQASGISEGEGEIVADYDSKRLFNNLLTWSEI